MSEAEIASGGSTPANGATTTATPPAQDTAGKPSGSTAAPPTAPVDQSKEPKGFMRRIDELTKLRRDAERDRDHWRELAMRSQPQQKQEAPKPKTFADFGYNEDAYRAHLLAEAKSNAPTPSADDLYQQFEQKRTAVERRQKFDQRAVEFAKANEDYAAVINGEWACSEPMAEVIEGSAEGPAIAYYLAQNPEIAAQLARLSASRAGVELARIEDRLVAERKKAAEQPVSKAPPPAPKIEGSDPANVERDPKKMDQRQFNKWREGFIAKRR